MIIYVKQSKRINIIAGIIIILAGMVMLYLWHLNPEFRTLYVGDSFSDANQFISGTNFRELGFWKLRFTADYAVGPAQYHPFYYTHNGPLSEILNGIYQKFGLVQIEWQRLVCIIWTLFGFLFFYAMLRLLAGQTVAFWSLVVAVTNPFVLYWGDNLYSFHQWMLVYLSLYSLVRYIRKSSLVAFLLAWLAFFFLTSSTYELVPQIAIFALGLRIFKLESLSTRKLLIFLSAPLAAFFLRNFLIIWAVGYHVWFRDLIEILLHRTFGIKTSIMEMYKHAPVIMWDTEIVIPKHFLQNLYLKLENLYGYGWSLFVIALAIPCFRYWVLPKTDMSRMYRLILVFFIMGISWFLLFPQHTSAHFHGSTMLLFLPFTCLLWSSVLVGLWQNITRLPAKIICFAVILCAIATARILNFVPPKPFPGIDVLRNYEGRVFCTDSIPTPVEYYTKTPAAFCGYEKQLRDLLQGKYYFFLRDDKLNLPLAEFFFCIHGWIDNWLAHYFPLVERGPGYAIYRLQADPSLTDDNILKRRLVEKNKEKKVK